MKHYSPGLLALRTHLILHWVQKEKFQYEADSNPERWTLFVVEKGSFQFKIQQHQGIAKGGDLLLCPPQISLHRKMIEPTTFLACYFYWYRPNSKDHIIISGDELLPNPTGMFHIEDTHRLTSTYRYLLQLVDISDFFVRKRRDFLLQDIWQQFTWEWETTRLKTQKQHNDPIAKMAWNVISEHFNKPFSMKALSHELSLSAVQLTRRFKAAYGVTPTQFLTSLRLNEAQYLLAETRLTLDEIAVKCGYDNGFYLSRVFSKKMKISPSEYRRAHQV